MVGEVSWKLNCGKNKQTKTCTFFVIVAHLGDLVANTFPNRPFIDCTNSKAAGKWSPFVDEF